MDLLIEAAVGIGQMPYLPGSAVYETVEIDTDHGDVPPGVLHGVAAC